METPPFDWLECLLAAADSRNLTEAARRVGLSQPGLSMKLLRLEKSVPMPLFQWDGRSKKLTPYGRALCDVVRRECDELAEGYSSVNRAYASSEHLTLKVGCRAELFELVSPWFRFPGKILLRTVSSPESTQLLLKHEIDIAVTHDVPKSGELIARPLACSFAKLAAHKKWLPSKMTLSLARDKEFLKRVPCIVYDEVGHLLSDWVASCGLSFSDLRVAVVVKDWRLIRSLVEQGLGFALLPDYLSFSSCEVEEVMLPEKIVTKFNFFGVFQKSLRKIPGFQPLPIISRPRSSRLLT